MPDKKKRKFNMKDQSNKITEYMRANTKMKPSQSDEYFGHTHKSKEQNVIRLWFTNPCGIGVDPNHIKSDDSFRFLKEESKCDIFGLAETNVHWYRLYNHASLYARTKQRWKYFKISTSHNRHENLGKSQRGGTCTVSTGQAAYRHFNRGEDDSGLGRWSWLEFRGKGDSVTRVYTAYRPGSKPTSKKKQYTTVYEQQSRYLEKHNINKEPRDFFDSSIKEELQIQAQRAELILMIDVNQDVINGHFSKMMGELGMYNVFETCYDKSSIPATHHRGSKPISAIYIGQRMQCRQCGILPKTFGVHGDHRNMYADISAQTFLGSSMYDVETQPMKQLQLKDSRIVDKFLFHMKQHIQKTKLIQKAQQVYKIAEYPCSETVSNQMEQIDHQMGRAITCGKRRCRKFRVGSIPYSDTFAQLRNQRRLWTLVRKKKLHQNISYSTIKRLSKSLQIPQPMSMPLAYVTEQKMEAERKYKLFKRQTAQASRTHFLQQLASANAKKTQQDTSKILTRIIHDEQVRNQTVMCRKYFPKKGSMRQRVDRIQYQDQAGQWIETDKPGEILQACQKDTKEKYSGTDNTPLMREPLKSKLGNFAETPFSTKFRHYETELPSETTSWTREMLDRVRSDGRVPQISREMTTADIKSAWRVVKEHKAAAPSGRYNGVYKAMCQDKQLLQLLTVTMNLPFKVGKPYQRWYKMVDIMAFKKQNNIKVTNIRAIIISESDWNTAGKILVARKLMKHAEKFNLLPQEHMGGRKGRKATDGALTKRLLLDNARIFKRSMAIISTDAANCYDRMCHTFISFSCIKWGLAIPIMIALLQPLQQAQHHTRTAYGDSKGFFKGIKLQGAGQGNTGAAPYWTCISSPMIEIMKERRFHSSFISPLSGAIIALSLLAFVDDAELFVTNLQNDPAQLIKKAEIAINVWRQLLYVTGGVMRASKCSWTLVAYHQNSAKTTMLPDSKFPGDISLLDERGNPGIVPRYDSNKPSRYLGVHQTTTGSEEPQIEVLKEKVDDWNRMIEHSRLPPALNLHAVLARIHRTIIYPLVATTIDEDNLQDISNKLYWKSLPKCGVIRTFPIKYRHLPIRYQGLGMPILYLEQEAGKLKEIMKFSDTTSLVWKQMKLGLEGLQQQIGLKNIIFDYPYEEYAFLAESSWLKSHWKFISQQGYKVQGWTEQQKPRRIGDTFLMEQMIESGIISPDDLKKINRCRLYLQVWTIADIATGDGKEVSNSYYKGHRDNARDTKKTHWKEMKRPNINYWFIWQKYISIIFCNKENDLQLRTPLGEWMEPPQNSWEWYYNPTNSSLYRIQMNKVCIYRRDLSARRNIRTNGKWFGNPTIMRRREFREQTSWFWRATVGEKSRGEAKVKCEGWSKHILPPTPTPKSYIINAHEMLQYHKVPNWMFKHGNLQRISIQTVQHMFQQPLRLVTDASYDDGAGSACVIIETWDQEHQMVIVGETPSNVDPRLGYNDSYRSEMYGLLFGFHAIRAIESHTGRTTSIIVSCDNDRVLDFASTRQYVTTKAQHFDICKSIICIRTQLRSTITYEEVEGHVKEKYNRKLTRLEELNDSCDIIAKSARGNRREAVHLEGEGLSIWHNGNKLYSDIGENIRRVYEDKYAEEILCEKYGWEKETFESINWQAMEKAVKILPRPTTIRISKYVTGTLPVGLEMERREQWKAAYCPRCKCPIETPEHIIQCPSEESRDLMQKSLEKINLWLTTMNTDEELHQQLLMSITSWITQEESTIPNPLPPIAAQMQIGWSHFMTGRIHISFQNYMSTHYKNIHSRRTGLKWATQLVVQLWNEIFEPQWSQRNARVHSINTKHKSSRENENLRDTIKELRRMETPDSLLWKDRILMQEPISQLLHRPIAQKKGWIHSFRIAQRSRDSSHSREEFGMTNVMHRFLRRNLYQTTTKQRKPFKKRRVGSKYKRKKMVLVCPPSRKTSKKKKRVGGKFRKVLTSVYKKSSQHLPRSSPTGTYSRGVKRKK